MKPDILFPAPEEEQPRKDPWTCGICGGEMIKPNGMPYLVCSLFHGRLHTAPSIKDLPLAFRAIYRYDQNLFFCKTYPRTKLWKITGHDGLWKYVPNAHKDALERRPPFGCVVAKVAPQKGKLQARMFRRAKGRS